MQQVITTADGATLKQVGTMVLRSPDGNPGREMPLYAPIDPSELDERGMTKMERRDCKDFASSIAELMKNYVEGCRAAGIAI